MTLQSFLEHRRAELLKFYSWRFGCSNWVLPAAYCTGFPKAIFQKLKDGACAPLVSRAGLVPASKDRHKILTIHDLARLEVGALHLGFRPRLKRSRGKPRYDVPPPPKLPRSSHRSVKQRWFEWLLGNHSSSIPKPEYRKRERKSVTL